MRRSPPRRSRQFLRAAARRRRPDLRTRVGVELEAANPGGSCSARPRAAVRDRSSEEVATIRKRRGLSSPGARGRASSPAGATVFPFEPTSAGPHRTVVVNDRVRCTRCSGRSDARACSGAQEVSRSSTRSDPQSRHPRESIADDRAQAVIDRGEFQRDLPHDSDHTIVEPASTVHAWITRINVSPSGAS